MVRTLGVCRECWEGCSLDRFWRELPRIHSRVLQVSMFSSFYLMLKENLCLHMTFSLLKDAEAGRKLKGWSVGGQWSKKVTELQLFR